MMKTKRDVTVVKETLSDGRRRGAVMKTLYTHYTTMGASMQPSCADARGYLAYRAGFERLPRADWTAAESWLHNMETAIEAWRKRKMKNTCKHRDVTTGPDYGFSVGVAVYPYTRENRAAHGNISYTETCRQCGAARWVNSNGGQFEFSPWNAHKRPPAGPAKR